MTGLSKSDYIQKYLSNPKKTGKKKKTVQNVKIVDDDDVIMRYFSKNANDSDDDLFGESAPVIAEVIDERPMHLRKGLTGWSTLSGEADHASTSKSAWNQSSLKTLSSPLQQERQFQDHSVSMKNKSPSDDSDLSPPRASKIPSRVCDVRSDSDPSPPRRSFNNISSKKDKPIPSDGGASPPQNIFRRRRHDSPNSLHNAASLPPLRHQSTKGSESREKKRHHDDSDPSPPRVAPKKLHASKSPKRRDDSDSSPPRVVPKKHGHDSPKRRHDSDSSPPLVTSKTHYRHESPKRRDDSDSSPPRVAPRKRGQDSPKRRHDSDSSLPRTKETSTKYTFQKRTNHNVHRRKHDSHSSSGESIPSSKDDNSKKRKSHKRSHTPTKSRRQHRHDGNDSDDSASSSRRSHNKSKKVSRRSRHDSPTHQQRKPEDKTTAHKSRISHHRDSPSPPRRSDVPRIPQHKDLDPLEKSSVNDRKITKTLSGKTAGLLSAKEMRIELAQIREKEKQALNQLNEELSGKNAATTVRKKRTVEKPEEPTKEELERLERIKQTYSGWSRGVKQISDRKQALVDEQHEMSKPLARYEGDEDLERHLREQVHQHDDPMAKYITKKKQKKEEKKAKETNTFLRPQYKGPAPPENRFGILPGYRWDGLDRSNGFEKKYFEEIQKKRALKMEAYKWSSEDM